MIEKVITIGSDSKCDFVINRNTYPTLMDCIIDRINPIHAQIIQDDDCCFLIPFSDYIYINNVGVTSHSFQLLKDSVCINDDGRAIRLDVEDRISIGIDVFWQQWMAGLGLCCNKCRYRDCSVQDDGWCKYCTEYHFNPPPFIYGFSNQFDYEHRLVSGFFNYTKCEKCGFKPDWCVECDFLLEPQPKNNSYKEHVDMYVQRLKCGKELNNE